MDRSCRIDNDRAADRLNWLHSTQSVRRAARRLDAHAGHMRAAGAVWTVKGHSTGDRGAWSEYLCLDIDRGGAAEGISFLI